VTDLVTATGRRLHLRPEPPVLGGEACVYRAVGPQGEDLAVKLALVPGERGAWLLREAELQRALAGRPELAPHLVLLCDVGTWQGRPYLVLPWVGRTLAEAAAQGEAPERRSLARRAAQAVAALHAAEPDLVHRDIKPSNFLVDGQGRVRLTDLGAARRLQPGATTTLTALHTPGFAAPEQSLAAEARPRRDQDLYALAATVFTVLVGRPPRATAWNRSQVLQAGRVDAPRQVALTPGDRAALERAGASPALAARLEAMLAPRPTDRRGGAEELARLLRAPADPLPRGGGLLALGAGLALLLLFAFRPLPAPPLYPGVLLPPGRYAVPASGATGEVLVLDRPLLVGEVELSQGLWRRLMGTDAARGRRQSDHDSLGLPCTALGPVRLVGDELPAVCMGWLDAVRSANALSAAEGLPPAYRLGEEPGAPAPEVTWRRDAPGWRLPTDAEWSALAGEQAEAFAPAFDPATACALGNVAERSLGRLLPATDHLEACDDGFAGLAPTGHYRPNRLGVRDVFGNAAEWVWDDSGPGRHMIRGVTWSSDPRQVHAPGPEGQADDMVNVSTGVRLVRSLP